MSNEYCMFKGKLKCGAPFSDKYKGSPHYVIRLTGTDDADFDIVVNAASTAPTSDGDNRVYASIDLHFTDPIIEKLKLLDEGLHTQNFPRLDYFQDASLVNLKSMRPIPYNDASGNRFDINDQVNMLLAIDDSQPSEDLNFNNGKFDQIRKFWTPTTQNVIVYGFGFLFQPAENGLHETHMNQGNPKNGGHAKENGAFQDGAVIVQIGDNFTAMFTAFQTPYWPTNAQGYPEPDSVALPRYIHAGASA